MRILAIDPGNEQSAWCAIDCGMPVSWAKERNADVLTELRAGKIGVDLLALEMIASYGMPVGREVFETVLWIGRFLEAWESRGGAYRLIYRRDVKLFLCESNRANDANIRAALIERFGPGRERAIGTKRAPGPLYCMKGDCWSALAVALTADGGRSSAPLFRERETTLATTEEAPF